MRAWRLGKLKDLDKTRMKLFPNFTRHHLITHTNKLEEYDELKNAYADLLCNFSE